MTKSDRSSMEVTTYGMVCCGRVIELRCLQTDDYHDLDLDASEAYSITSTTSNGGISENKPDHISQIGPTTNCLLGVQMSTPNPSVSGKSLHLAGNTAPTTLSPVVTSQSTASPRHDKWNRLLYTLFLLSAVAAVASCACVTCAVYARGVGPYSPAWEPGGPAYDGTYSNYRKNKHGEYVKDAATHQGIAWNYLMHDSDLWMQTAYAWDKNDAWLVSSCIIVTLASITGAIAVCFSSRKLVLLVCAVLVATYMTHVVICAHMHRDNVLGYKVEIPYSVKGTVRRKLLDSMVYYRQILDNRPTMETHIWDSMQFGWCCCGVDSYRDWHSQYMGWGMDNYIPRSCQCIPPAEDNTDPGLYTCPFPDPPEEMSNIKPICYHDQEMSRHNKTLVAPLVGCLKYVLMSIQTGYSIVFQLEWKIVICLSSFQILAAFVGVIWAGCSCYRNHHVTSEVTSSAHDQHERYGQSAMIYFEDDTDDESHTYLVHAQ